jgi:hypothetical protein
MKKLFLIVCTLAAALIALKIVSRKSETTQQAMREGQSTAKSPSDLATLRSRESQLSPALPTSGDTTNPFSTGTVPSTNPVPQAAIDTDEVHVARERWRQELKVKGEHKEMFAKEEEWKEKSKFISNEMMLLEVVAIMGVPTSVKTFVDTGPESAELMSVPVTTLSNVTRMAFVYYSPDGQPPPEPFVLTLSRPAPRLPFDHFSLTFDEQGKLRSKSWVEEGLEASLLRNVAQPQKSENAFPESGTSPKP